jgi:uncharacterized protein
MTVSVDRYARIDALRGLAVFGILLVNIWSFVWGFEPLRYGILQPDATLLDMLSVAFVAFFAEQKFYPIFAFLFGASFVLITQSIKRRTGEWRDAKRLYRRRLRWLLGCGVLHGTLIWFGDILTLYSIAGFWVLAGLVGARLRAVTTSLRNWAIVFVVLLMSGFLLNVLLLNAGGMATQAAAAAESVQRVNFVYTYGSMFGIAWQRLSDYLTMMMQSVFIVPHVAVLFLLGALSARRRWLTQPWRHRAFWRRTQLIGFAIGIPFNLLWATLKLTEVIDPLNPSMLDYALYSLLALGGSCLAAAYVATFMLAGDGFMRPLQAWLAPVGRMALTHYLTQSLLCAILLQGFGFGLGATLPPSGLMAMAFAIMLLQILWSRWWLAHHEQGPLEILSRRMINRD